MDLEFRLELLHELRKKREIIFFLFNFCVIKNAPLENQSAMEKSLEQTLQPWKLMADTQLREACEAVVKNDTFQEVKNHYTQSGTNYGCVF